MLNPFTPVSWVKQNIEIKYKLTLPLTGSTKNKRPFIAESNQLNHMLGGNNAFTFKTGSFLHYCATF